MSDVAAMIDACRARLAVGEVALVPTDTVYGLAAALDVPGGVDALYRLKGRPRSQPCQVLLLAAAAVDEALRAVPEPVAGAVRVLTPGTVTCIVPDPSGRFAAAAGDQPGSVGLRVPAMDAIFARLDLPLVATSANDPGGPDPRRTADVPRRIRAGLGATIDVGALPGTASSVVDLRPVPAGGDALLLRPGPDPERTAAALAELGIALRPTAA